MGLKAEGRLHDKGEAIQISERFTKREFVLEMGGDGRYPQLVQFQLTGDRCEKLDAFEVGQDVSVEFSLRGREWTNPDSGVIRYFNSLDVWVVRAEGPAPEPPPTRLPDPDEPEEPPIDDNIPF